MHEYIVTLDDNIIRKVYAENGEDAVATYERLIQEQVVVGGGTIYLKIGRQVSDLVN